MAEDACLWHGHLDPQNCGHDFSTLSCSLQQIVVGHGEPFIRFCNDDVVQDAYVDQCERLLNPAGDVPVSVAGYGKATGMVVCQHDGLQHRAIDIP